MNEKLRDGLVKQQRRDGASEERFRMEIRRVTESKLTTAKRVAWVLSGLMGLSFVVLFGYVAWTAPSDLPLIGRLTFVAGAVFGAVWAGLCVYILKKGSTNLRTDENAVNGLVWLVMVLMMTAFLLMGAQMEDRVLGISVVLYGLVFFVVFAIPAILNLRVNRLEMNLREQMLKMQITLAEIVENQSQLRATDEPRGGNVQWTAPDPRHVAVPERWAASVSSDQVWPASRRSPDYRRKATLPPSIRN